VQSLTVLLLDVSYESAHLPKNIERVLPPLKKLVEWLRVLRANNGVAARAYRVVMNLIKKLTSTLDLVGATIRFSYDLKV